MTPEPIVYVPISFYPGLGGYANATTGFARALSETKALRLHVFTTEPLGDQREIELPGVEVTRVARGARPETITTPINLYRAIVREYPRGARVLIETGELPLLAVLLQRRFGKDAVRVRLHACYDTEFYAWRGRATDRINRRLLSRFLRNADVHVATNQYHLRFAIEHFLGGNWFEAARKRLVVIPNAVAPKEGSEATLPVEGPFLFTLGRMKARDDVAQKGFDDLLDALALLGDSIPQRVLFVGKGAEQTRLRARADALGLGPRVVFVDGLSEAALGRAIRSADACVLPSRYEGYSMFAAEVTRSGGLLVGTRRTGLEDLVDHGVTGWLVEPHDAAGLASALREVAALDPAGRTAMRAAAVRKLARQSDPERLAALTRALWDARPE